MLYWREIKNLKDLVRISKFCNRCRVHYPILHSYNTRSLITNNLSIYFLFCLCSNWYAGICDEFHTCCSASSVIIEKDNVHLPGKLDFLNLISAHILKKKKTLIL